MIENVAIMGSGGIRAGMSLARLAAAVHSPKAVIVVQDEPVRKSLPIRARPVIDWPKHFAKIPAKDRRNNSTDVYVLCPCGSGLKLKFCCWNRGRKNL